MSIPHAAPGEAIDVRPLGSALRETVTTVLVKADELEVIRMVVPAGKEIAPHQAKGAITVHCLEGRIAFTIGDQTTELVAGHLLYLPAGVRHAVRGLVDASVLLTIRL
ncbi:MAG: cupin domain-containing protein [Gemmataceae bacterium]|jgi:quercetin dioxygenase-like cupin family protein